MKKILALVLTLLCIVSFGTAALTFAEDEPSEVYGTQLSDWKGTWGAGTMDGEYFIPSQYDYLAEGIASDFIGVKVKITALGAGSWMAVQLGGDTAATEWNQTGAHIKFTDSDGKVRMDIYGFNGNALVENVVFSTLDIGSQPEISIKLIKDAGAYTLNVNGTPYTNATLLTDAQMRDVNGKTYVNFAKAGDTWGIKFLRIASTQIAYEPPKTTFGKEVSDWKGTWGAGVIENGGYAPVQYDFLAEGIASDYIGVTVEITKLNEGSWMAVQIAGNTDACEWNHAGAHIKFSNSSGKIRLDVYGFGGQAAAENVILDGLSASTVSQVRIELIYDETNGYVLRVNEKAIKSALFTTAQFRDNGGLTYVNFAKFGGADTWHLRFMDITTVAPYGRALTDWENTGSFGSITDYRYSSFATDGLVNGIKSDYIELDLSFATIASDGWTSVQITGDTNAVSYNESGFHIVFRADNKAALRRNQIRKRQDVRRGLYRAHAPYPVN